MSVKLEREIAHLPLVESKRTDQLLTLIGSRVSVPLDLAEAVAIAGDLIEAARLCIGRTGWAADAPALDGSDLRCR